MLEVRAITCAYGAAAAVHAVSLQVPAGGSVCVLGPNGAGKSTTLRAIAGLKPPVAGQVLLDGTDITRWTPDRRNAAGLSLCPEGRRVFAALTVRENLLAGGQALRAADRSREFEKVLAQLPMIRGYLDRYAGSLSGGEQQALAIGRALMSRPRILLLDEPSLGLSPMATEAVFDVLHALKQQGMAILLIEQNAHLALELADYAYVLSEGRVLSEGAASTVAASPEIMEAYLGA